VPVLFVVTLLKIEEKGLATFIIVDHLSVGDKWKILTV
jgi:hypothetical protein